jgi:hypothetical protein
VYDSAILAIADLELPMSEFDFGYLIQALSMLRVDNYNGFLVEEF